MSLNSFVLFVLPFLLVRGVCLRFHLYKCASRSEGILLLLEVKDGDVVIPDFLGRLGLLTSRVLCPAAKVYRSCRVLLCQRNVTVDSGLCSGVWGSLLNTPGLDCGAR